MNMLFFCQLVSVGQMVEVSPTVLDGFGKL